jgi:DNA-binding transcriptional LysR family regulator
LFARVAGGVHLTPDGRAFLPHAREVLRAVDRAVLAVRPERRVLRVDVAHRRIAPAAVLHAFHREHPDLPLEVVTLADRDVVGAVEAVRDGTIDAAFRAVPPPRDPWPELRVARAVDSGVQLLVGPRHPLAERAALRPSELARHRVWVPGIVPGTEWARFYQDLAAEFGLSVDGRGPHFGDEALLEELATSAEVATVIGSGDRYLWPAHYDLRRIPLRDPTPVYPHCLVWSAANDHPGLADLRAWLAAERAARPGPGDRWEPGWASGAG